MSTLKSRGITIADRLYDHIYLPPLVIRAIDTEAFQRLRTLKQLGASSFLFPSAVHTRFEHSIGVAHMARTLLTTIREQQPDLGLTDEDVTITMLAGLYHDIGHGPFSHLFEDVITKRLHNSQNTTASPDAAKNYSFSHEEMSQRIAKRTLSEFLPAATVQSILNLMKGESSPSVPYGEIISNKRNGIDTDRVDYFIRDSVCCFGSPTIDIRSTRLFYSAKLVCHESQWQFAFQQKAVLSLREMFTLRAKMHKNVYQHRVTKSIGHMIGDVFHLAFPYFKLVGRRLDECIQDDELFLKLGDWILEAIESSDDPMLKPAQLVLKRLRRRELYRLAYERPLIPSRFSDWKKAVVGLCGGEQEKPIRIEEMLARLIKENEHPSYKINSIDDFIVDIHVINQGMGSRDPLENVVLFDPKRPSNPVYRLSESAAKASTPLFTPLQFEERSILIFERVNTKGAVAHACERLFNSDSLAPYSFKHDLLKAPNAH